MLRMTGCVMVTLGCLGLGLWYRQQFLQRLHHIRVLSQILEMMMSEVSYNKATLPECCLHLSKRLESPYRQAFEEVHGKMLENTGEGFGQVFHDRMKSCLEEVPLQKEEKELFLQFSRSCGFEDGKMQLRSMEQYNDRLKSLIHRLEQETAEKCRMALGLGAMSGLLLVIILL